MPFDSIPGGFGKIYVPERKHRLPCKNSCPDCFSCQFCSDDRCNVCQGAPQQTDDRPLQTASEGELPIASCSHRRKTANTPKASVLF